MTAHAPDSPSAWEYDEVIPGLHRVRCGISNAYLWRPAGDERATLVDTGPVGTFPRLRRTLTDLGVAPHQLERVVLTHFHDDHTAAAAEVVAWSGARVVAGRADAPHIRGETPGPVPVLTAAEVRLHAAVTSSAVAEALEPVAACPVDVEVDDGDLLDLGDLAGGPSVAAHVLVLPGHTPGSIALHLPAVGVVLTGDAVAEHEGRIVLGPFGIDREQAWRDAARLASLEVDVACFGHGEPVIGRAAQALRSLTDAFA
ncbi:Glyoxylase, beta-lactamase superfamily II [Quadrisphaera granulorum]|uniref:Glyoxylase-like metal-dependent hydrolase (Beta-lactamase superfamily II) n=1 Tax=Quadrisphaera granulorum TaxID=317664 RepID=A0A316AB14_9ACTN|nr:MBL fold metallo-hydrolase [Quadrisphaera granulorum]PWJ54190.1 glyoxylase-like metal-dependent hydrolase (beta-lactamase superfamily II) [Quadrisphaera granulorum]SZE96329.1 Glyoxylase, beta-lactamase superfamily II [Quadrisphaera granulorum]